MPWQLLIVLYSIVGGLRNVVVRQLGTYRQDYSVTILLYSFLAVFLTGIGYVFLTGETVDMRAGWEARYFIAVGGVLFVLQNLLFIKLLRRVGAAVGALLVLLNPLAVVLLTMAFTDERLTILQMAGASILLLSVFSAEISTTKKKIKYFHFSKNVLIAAIIALFFGLASLNEKYLIDRLELPTYVVLGWGGQFIATVVLVFVMRKEVIWKAKPKINLLLGICAILYALSGFLFVSSIVSSQSIVLPVVSGSAKLLTTVVLAYLLLKERQYSIVRFLSVMGGVVGLYLLFR
jgi:drug/metabolite transporter (DMT)-like permease